MDGGEDSSRSTEGIYATPLIMVFCLSVASGAAIDCVRLPSHLGEIMKLETINTAGVKFVVVENNKPSTEFMCRRPNGRNLYYILLHENGRYSKPKPISMAKSRQIMSAW